MVIVIELFESCFYFKDVINNNYFLIGRISVKEMDAITLIIILKHSHKIFISVFNQLDAQNLFHNKFYFMLLHVSSTCAHHQEVKIVLHSLWHHHTETSEWSKITKIQLCKCGNCILVILLLFAHIYRIVF